MKANYFREACCFPPATMIHNWSVNKFASENKVDGDALRDTVYL